jgi:chromosome partitioning protein
MGVLISDEAARFGVPLPPFAAATQAALREMLPPELMFKQSIPRLNSFLEASARGVPVALLKHNPPPEALLFDQLAAELEERIGLTRERDFSHVHSSLMD